VQEFAALLRAHRGPTLERCLCCGNGEIDFVFATARDFTQEASVDRRGVGECFG